MKKLLVSCMMCLCAGAAMAQVPVKAAETGVEALAAGASTAGKLGIQIPLVEMRIQQVTAAVLAKSAQAGKNMVQAAAVLKHLTPEQQMALNVRGLAASFDPLAFNYSLEGLSQEQIEKLKESLLAQENELIATRATILERQLPLLSQYAPYMKEEIAKAFHPAVGENTGSWIAGQLPQNLEFLCIAEENAFMLEGLTTMDNLLTAIRAKFPEREIVLLTSFVPNQTVFFPGNSVPRNDYHYQVWQSALNNNMTVAGVDISVKMPQTGYLHPQSETPIEITESSTGQTAMGQEEQRKQFVRAINDIKAVQKNGIKPLFILYGRPVNMLYSGFASVADDLVHSFGKVKVLHLAPTTGVDAAGQSTLRTTDFERILPPGAAFQLTSPANKNIAWGPNSSMPVASGADIISKQDRR
ncbi:MAG: hypothetical protein IKP06_03805 [Elusimicrobiaceae bacterium]|nr:hypothetical protein [Elusimicrobiaceae bacterium]